MSFPWCLLWTELLLQITGLVLQGLVKITGRMSSPGECHLENLNGGSKAECKVKD